MDSILLQPSYFPSILQMAAMVQASSIVFEIEDNYQKQSYRNRTYIAHSNGILLLTIPIKHAIDGCRLQTKEVQIENAFPWQKQHWRSLETAYRTSPYFEYYEDELKPLFFNKETSLLNFNLKTLTLICELLDLEINYTFSKEYFKNPKQLDLRFIVNPKLQTATHFQAYTQVLNKSGTFIPNLSILDLLFNEGTNALTYLENLKLNFL